VIAVTDDGATRKRWQLGLSQAGAVEARSTGEEHSCAADRVEPASQEQRILAVAYIDVITGCLRALDAPDAGAQRAKVKDWLSADYRKACPSHEAPTPQELLLQVPAPRTVLVLRP
jgi:hypothetical protein